MARGSIIKKGDNYYIVYRFGGKQRWRAAGRTKKGAERTLTEIMAEVHRGSYRELKKMNFEEFAGKWLKIHASKVKDSTIRSYRQIAIGHLVPAFGSFEMESIETSQVEEYVAAKLAQLSPATLHRHLAVLKKMLSDAVRWGYLRQNPAAQVSRPRREKKEADFLIPSEIRKFLANVRKTQYPLFLTLCSTGLRLGEALALCWGDIDWNRQQIFVRRSLWQGEVQEPKSKSSVRPVVLVPTLAKAFREHKRFQFRSLGPAAISSDSLIFTNTEGKPLDPENLRRREFKPALRWAGIRDLRIHDLRHTFASLLIHQGENIKFISHQLGHSSVQITLDLYGHLLPEAMNEATERLETTIFGGEAQGFVRKMLEEPLSEEDRAREDPALTHLYLEQQKSRRADSNR